MTEKSKKILFDQKFWRQQNADVTLCKTADKRYLLDSMGECGFLPPPPPTPVWLKGPPNLQKFERKYFCHFYCILF